MKPTRCLTRAHKQKRSLQKGTVLCTYSAFLARAQSLNQNGGTGTVEPIMTSRVEPLYGGVS